MAESLLHRGLFPDARRMLSQMPTPQDENSRIEKLVLEAAVLSRQEQYLSASERLNSADQICRHADLESCGSVLRAHGVLAIDEGELGSAREYFLKCLSAAKAHHDRFLAATVLLNLGVVALRSDHFDEAADWSEAARQGAAELDAGAMLLVATGNLGWAYFELGDRERALDLFVESEKRARELGSAQNQIRWLENIGYVYQSNKDPQRAIPAFHRALELAKQIDSKSDLIISLEDLAFSSIDAGRLDEASSCLDQADPLIRTSGSRHDELWVKLARSVVAAQRGHFEQAAVSLRVVLEDPDSQTSIKLEAGHQLALLEEGEGRAADADRSYKATLATFEEARGQLKKEDSRLPFVANAAAIYDDYVHFLVKEGRSLQALSAADESRARTLEDGLGLGAGKTMKAAGFDPRAIATKTKSTLLFYWLGEKQSYLWAVTPAKVALFPLPARAEIAARVERYRQVLMDLRDPLEGRNADGQALYQMLIAPAASLLQKGKPVIVLDEGVLSKLNFETLLAPGAGPYGKQGSDSAAQLHYLIDDFTFSSAPSLSMLAAAKPESSGRERMLLLGNPVAPNRDFPSLPMFGFEMSKVESRFGPKQLAVYAGARATPAAYATSDPGQYSYIHFVSHAVANSTNPLDSAIILSEEPGQEDAYKLYAREIIQHPIDAKLVTISACYGSGTRAYSGEGLVGLSWAFLRAGAHKVIGALWEVSDDSTPQLMDHLYEGLERGDSPAQALHNAKLELVHSNTRVRLPFYWAPFQIYGR